MDIRRAPVRLPDHVALLLRPRKSQTQNLPLYTILTPTQNVSSLTAQARQFPLKKPAGFHWDFFLLGCTTFVAGILGLPMPNGLVPQAPVHTDSLTIYETRVEIIHTQEEGESREIQHKPVVTATAVVEQRISHFLMGLALIGTMTGPLLIVLHTMPSAVFGGVFFVVGVSLPPPRLAFNKTTSY
jgi:hypothetical protein